MAEQRLLKALADVRRRLLGISLASGTAWGLVAGFLVLIACAWIDLALDLPSGLRLTCSLAAIACGILLIGWAGVNAMRHSTQGALARRLDGVANSGGQILSGVDLFRQYASEPSGGSAAVASGGLSGALARIAIERAASLASRVGVKSAVPNKPITTPLFSLGGIALALGLVGIIAPRLFATQWLRFTDPYGDHPPYSAITFQVEPGNTKVLYGGGLDVRARAEGGAVDQLDLVLLNGNGKQEVLPMFPEPGGSWRATVADITATGRYFVRTRGARSRQFTYGLITVPELKDVKFRLTAPAYTRRPAYEGPLPQNGLAGLPGTKVEIWAKSNRPLSGGAITFTASADDVPTGAATQKSAPVVEAVGPIAMTPIGAGASEVHGSFTITKAGRIDLKVTDVEGESSRQSYSASVALLRDDRPFVRLMEPKANSFATPDVSLPVSILAEDDYGVTRVQLFRSLNESRPLGMDAAVPPETPAQLPVAVGLPLAQYGLVPGDVIKLFARVEDNDPAGTKGSESAIVTVQIISREDLNRMVLARDGMEVLQSKYAEAQRRLEALDEEIRKLQEELKDADPNAELGKEMKDKLDHLADRAMEAAQEIAKNAKEDLPFDLDVNLRNQLKDTAKATEEAAQEFKESTKQPGLPGGLAGKALDELRKKLGTKREQLKEEANDPIEHLAKIFPLKEDEMRFTDLYLRQRDLEERMAGLKAQPGDDPKTKSRMRDLENEQRQLREELRELLDDIDNHVAALPDDPRLDDLRNGAKEFCEAVRSSHAADEMRAAESSLSEFAGSDGTEWAKKAADTLEKFIGQCKGGMGDPAGMCLKFQPSLSTGLGNTVEQLLEGSGMKPGKGMGGGGGYSTRRSTLSNVGLYGSLPRPSRQASRNGNGRDTRGSADRSDGSPNGLDDPSGFLSSGRLKAAGESGANVPAQYRKKVGEYFQRVADELSE